MRLLHVQHTSKYLKLNFVGEQRSKPTINAIAQANKMAKLMRARTVHTRVHHKSTVLHMHGLLICWF